jgi:hypothetical protein
MIDRPLGEQLAHHLGCIILLHGADFDPMRRRTVLAGVVEFTLKQLIAPNVPEDD